MGRLALKLVLLYMDVVMDKKKVERPVPADMMKTTNENLCPIFGHQYPR